MTEDSESRREVRDDDLIKRLAYRTIDLIVYFQKWIELETKELNIDLIEVIPQCTEQKPLLGLEIKQKRVCQIAYKELPGHIGYLEESAEFLKNGASNDLIKDMWQLEDGINYLRGLVRELKDIRTFVDEVTDRQINP